jgi:hypothetical protein
VDTFNCGPVACMKILKIYNLTTSYEINLAYNTNSICSFVISEWTRLVAQCNNDLILHVRERIPLLEPWPEDVETTTVPRRSYPTIDAAVAAAAAASADAPEADMDICFCCCNSLAMELVCLTCCKKNDSSAVSTSLSLNQQSMLLLLLSCGYGKGNGVRNDL